MAHVNYEHLTIFEEQEFNLHAQVFAGLLIVTKFPPCPYIQVEVPRSVNRCELLRVLKENTGIELPLQNVFRLFGDYVLLTQTFKEATRIMSFPYIQVDNHVLAILGWTPDYGSTTLFLDESIPLEHQIQGRQQQPQRNNVPLSLLISGMPPQLFLQCPTILHRIFANICNLRDIHTRKVDFSFRAHTSAPRNAIPSVVHVVVRRVQTGGGSYLSIWPLWIRADVLPPGDPTAI